jgi:imidazolonepropionase-like amidohydrolase
VSPSIPFGLDPLSSSSSSVVTARRAFTATGAPPVEDAAVVIEDATIAWVGHRARLPERYEGLPVDDHPEATVLPGLIETHAHLGSYTPHISVDAPDPSVHERSLVALSSVAIARQLASVGVTTVQSLGSRHFADVALRDAVAAGLLAGPRIVAAGPQLTTTSGHAWATGGEVDSVDDIRLAVRRHHKAGADVIKVMATGGFMTARTAPWHAQFTQEELAVLVREAHRLGKHTAAHAHGTEGIRRATLAGIDYIAHASFVDEAGRTAFDPWLADQLAERGVFVDTCSPPSWPAVEGETISPRAYELYRHGVRLVAGHDIGAVLPPSAYTYGLRQLHDSGIPIEEVLLAATSRAAAAVGLAGLTGVLAEGYAADLIVVEGDPLVDLAALDRLRRVIIAGRDFRPDPVTPYDPPARSGGGGPSDVRHAFHQRRLRAASHPLPTH